MTRGTRQRVPMPRPSRRRTSFFGGSVSTRKEAAAPGWKAKPGAADSRVSPSDRRQQPPAVSQGRKPGQPGLKRARDEPIEDGASAAHAKAEAKRKRLAYARDYGALQVRVCPHRKAHS